MRKIPKYILDKIDAHNRAIIRCVELEREIGEWYEKVIGSSDAVENIPEDEWCCFSFDSEANWISADILKTNLELADRVEE